MSWSWRLGRILGIDVYLHATFGILLAWVAIGTWLRTETVAGTVQGVGFMLAVFTTVVLHEFGHAMAARRYGIATKDITLYPIGGVARLERMPEKPGEELIVALAGPAVNVAIALVLLVALTALHSPLFEGDPDLFGSAPLLTKLLWVNVTLAVFNLIPAFPMDGGRVLRALLAARGDYVSATRAAASIGQGFALLLGLFGLFNNPFLVFVALFVWMGAAAEATAVTIRASLMGLPVSAAMITDFRALSVRDTLADAAQALIDGSQVDFPVLDDQERLVGVLTRSNLVHGLNERGPLSLVGAAMSQRFETAHPAEMLEVGLMRLQGCACTSMPVVSAGRLIGIVTMENIGELLLMKDLLKSKPTTDTPGRRVA